jgi:lipid-A-disaccharide synthase
MTPKRFMVIAGEPSGDMLAAELVKELRAALDRVNTYSTSVQPLQADLAPRFFGAGGPRMAAAGVELAFDLTKHAVIGLPGLRDFLKFRRFLNQLIALAREREPHVIICVDFQFFNGLFAAAVKKHVRARRGTFNNWEPKIIKYISPQVWASREHRVQQVARDFDLVLSIIPFEKDWYTQRVPKLPVEFIGHPMMERHLSAESGRVQNPGAPLLVLLPGSRPGELRRHLPVMLGAFKIIRDAQPGLRACIVVPSESLVEEARRYSPPADVEVRCGGLAEALASADLAISKTGTVSLECAYFGVPTVTMYKTSWGTYEYGKRVVKVKSLTMPNLLANETVFPEFIQHEVTPQNIAHAALELLRDEPRREKVRVKLKEVIVSLGGPGASRRAAEAILKIAGLNGSTG